MQPEDSSWDTPAVKPSPEPEDLDGCFVIEAGERGAWPVLTFCDNSGAVSRETRLFFGGSWVVVDIGGDAIQSSVAETSDSARMLALIALNGRTVQSARLRGAGDLAITFVDESRLVLSGIAIAETTGEPWWFSPWHSWSD